MTVLDGQRYIRKVRANGSAQVDGLSYYIEHAWAGKQVSLRLDAREQRLAVEYQEQPIKSVPIKGLIGER